MRLEKSIWNSLLEDVKNLEADGLKITGQYIIDNYGVTKHAATQWLFAIENRDILHNDISAPRTYKQQNHVIKELRKENSQLYKSLDELEERYDTIAQITPTKSFTIPSYKKDTPSKVKGKNEAIAFAILSDIHIEENITKEQTDGMNEYNPEIGTKRVETFFKSVIKLVEKERSHCNIDTLTLALLGDNITGYIHEELMETNNMSPTEATTFVRNMLITGIKYLVDHGNFTKILVPCTPGNHGRTTKLKRISTGYKSSYEWMMYQDMKKIFSDYLPEKYSKIVTFHTSHSELVYLDFYNKYRVRFCHGDHFKFAGGIGGLNVPLKKWLMRMNEQNKANMTFMGHWHQMLLGVTNDCMLNGSVMGMNAYSKMFGGIPESPKQIFTLLDKERGFTMRTPIDLD